MPVIGVLLGLLLLFLFGKLLVLPLRILGRLLINGIAGAILLVLVNLAGGVFGLHLQVTVWHALIAGFFGLPGVIVLLLLQ